MKTISSVLINCYNIKEWIESQWKKQLVKKEYMIKLTLQLFIATESVHSQQVEKVQKGLQRH
jgi:hypothetical protein